MSSPEQVPKELEGVTSDDHVSDHGVASEHEGFNNPEQSAQAPSTEDPPTTTEAVLRILTAVERISSRVDRNSDGLSSDATSKTDSESAASSSEIVEGSVASQDDSDDSVCPDIERLPMSSWDPRDFRSNRMKGERRCVLTAFYTDLPTETTTAEDSRSNADFVAAYSKDKWSSAPQRILIHSTAVMKQLRSITNVPDAQKTGVLAMVPPFKYLIHYRTAIKSKLDELKEAASDRESSPSVTKDELAIESQKIQRLQCIHDFIQTDLANYIGLELRCQSGDIDEVLFEEAYHLFKPGDLILVRETGENQLCQVSSVTGGRMLLSSRSEGLADNQGQREPQMRAGSWTDLLVSCFAMAWDGENIGARHSYYIIPYFAGTRSVTDLEVFPIQFHKHGSELRGRLCVRGSKYVQCAGHKRYTGTSVLPHNSLLPFTDKWSSADVTGTVGRGGNKVHDQQGTLRPFEMVQGDVYLDYKAIYTSFFNTSPALSAIPAVMAVGEEAEAIDNLGYGRTWNCSDRHIDGLLTSRFLSMNQHLIRHGKPKECLADDSARLQLLPGQVPAFIFSTRKWACLDINNIEEIDKSEESKNSGWKELVIPHKFSELLLSLVSNHISDIHVRQREALARHDSSNQIDIVRGKGRGLIILLHGPPGSGKTSTAETIAAYTGRPLYAITCGDLGSSPKALETNIVQHTRLAQKWGCVLLLDEADVFLGSRTYENMHRNAMVSVFLRQLEYYSGILFLTTNIVGVIDEAFKSRIHVALEYPAIDEESTLEIWRNLLQRISRENTNAEIKIRFDEAALLRFAKKHYRNHRLNGTTWNGRQIRNAFQTAIGIGQFERQRKISEAEAKGKEPDKTTRYIKLSVASFATVAETTSDFERYITRTRGDDRERAAAHEFRHDEHSRERPLRKKYRSGAGSYRAEVDTGASRAGRSKMTERRYQGASSSPAPKRTEKGKETLRRPGRASPIVSDSDDPIGQDEVYESGGDEGSDEEIIEDDIGDDDGDEDNAE